MKIVMGIDDLERAKVVSGLLERLRFKEPTVELAHVLERVGAGTLAPPMEGARPDLIERFLKMQEEEAEALLAEGKAELKRRGLACRGTLLTGFSANRLIAHAEALAADLLALGSSGKGPVESVILGSVGRKALISAPCSVLIAKRAVAADRPLTVVCATDHSAYAERCMEKLLAWRPQGIGRLVVATVYSEQLVQAVSPAAQGGGEDPSRWLPGELERSNQRLIDKVRPLAGSFTSRVESGKVGDTLARIMTEETADLLVLGAQGHGFLERMTIGSVSLEQGIRRPYPVLVVRA